MCWMKSSSARPAVRHPCATSRGPFHGSTSSASRSARSRLASTNRLRASLGCTCRIATTLPRISGFPCVVSEPGPASASAVSRFSSTVSPRHCPTGRPASTASTSAPRRVLKCCAGRHRRSMVMPRAASSRSRVSWARQTLMSKDASPAANTGTGSCSSSPRENGDPPTTCSTYRARNSTVTAITRTRGAACSIPNWACPWVIPTA